MPLAVGIRSNPGRQISLTEMVDALRKRVEAERVGGMTVRILIGDCRTVLATLPDQSVQCCVTENNGRIKPGQRLSPATEFKKGQHWREPKPHWERDWLVREYVDLRKSAFDIAKDVGCTDANIIFWLKKHGIERRTTSAARSIKRWGCKGASNPMFGRTGEKNPRYVDGSSPERQRLYAQSSGKSFLIAVYTRDGFRCVKCAKPNAGVRSLHAHHIRPWAGNRDLRFAMDNVVTLCNTCHHWVHSKRNVEREFLA